MSDFYVCLRCNGFNSLRYCPKCGAKAQSEEELVRYNIMPVLRRRPCPRCREKMDGILRIDDRPFLHFYCSRCGCDFYEGILYSD